MTITIDNTTYTVRVPYESISRTFSLITGSNGGTTMDYTEHRDVVGTKYTYKMDIYPEPAQADQYNSLYEVLSAPTESHSVTFPYGNTTVTINAAVTTATDTYRGNIGGTKKWKGLSVTFSSVELNRTT